MPTLGKRLKVCSADGTLVHPVETEVVSDTGGIEQLFVKWVEGEGAEGLVVRSDSAGLFKVKPRHTLDAVVIGFTESTDDRAGMMHDLLLAVMRHDGTLHIMCRVGGGFSEDLRRTMLSDLKDMVVPSEYAEVNSDYVAYQMVRPDWVVEISCLDLISQTTRGGDINRMVLDYDSAAGRLQGRTPTAAGDGHLAAVHPCSRRQTGSSRRRSHRSGQRASRSCFDRLRRQELHTCRQRRSCGEKSLPKKPRDKRWSASSCC